MSRGFTGFVKWLFCLHGGGEWYRGIEQVEGAALVGGQYGYLSAGAVVADLVAGEGGQVIEQAAEAA